MSALEILIGTGIMLFIILLILVVVLAFKFTGPNRITQNSSSKEDLEKIKAQIEK